MSKLRSVALLLIVSLFLMVPTAAYGDVINYPSDTFYRENADACEELKRPFFVEGRGGFATILEEPGIGREIAEVPNGDTLYVLHTFEYEGELWGHVYVGHYMSDYYKSFGWVPMSQLTAAYISEVFVEEHESVLYTEGADLSALETVSLCQAYTYPGSGIINYDIDMDLVNIYGFITF